MCFIRKKIKKKKNWKIVVVIICGVCLCGQGWVSVLWYFHHWGSLCLCSGWWSWISSRSRGVHCPVVCFGVSKGRGTGDQIANIFWIIKKAREFQKNIYFCFIDYAKAFDCVDHNKLWKIFQEMGIPDHLTCLLRNLYAG